jgi:rapamycin-insensitive companion of mTOR
MQSLVVLIEEKSGTVNRKAILLLGELLQMANRILPMQYAAQLQVSSRLSPTGCVFHEKLT